MWRDEKKNTIHQHCCITQFNVYFWHVNTDSVLLLSLFFLSPKTKQNRKKNDFQKIVRKVWMPSNPVAMLWYFFLLIFLSGDFFRFDCRWGKLEWKKKNSFTKYIKILYEQKIDFVSLAINFNSNGSMSRSTFQLSHTQQWFFLFCHHPLSLSVLVRHSMPFFLVCLCEAVFFSG